MTVFTRSLAGDSLPLNVVLFCRFIYGKFLVLNELSQ